MDYTPTYRELLNEINELRVLNRALVALVTQLEDSRSETEAAHPQFDVERWLADFRSRCSRLVSPDESAEVGEPGNLPAANPARISTWGLSGHLKVLPKSEDDPGRMFLTPFRRTVSPEFIEKLREYGSEELAAIVEAAQPDFDGTGER